MKSEIELFRVISIFGIIWFHSGIQFGKDVAYGGLVFFIIISVYFATTSCRSHTFWTRIERLIIPYILWSTFYGIITFKLKGVFFPADESLFSIILSSTSIHLWFLPFIFFVLLTIDNLRSLLFKEWFGILIGISAILSISLAPIWRGFNYIPPLGQYAHAIPAVLIGVFLGVYNKIRPKVRLWIITSIILSISLMVFKQQPGIGIPYVVGLTPCIFLFYENILIKNNKIILSLASATFGVYLLHVFSILILRHIGVKSYTLPIATFLLSISLVLVFRYYFPKIVKYIM